MKTHCRRFFPFLRPSSPAALAMRRLEVSRRLCYSTGEVCGDRTKVLTSEEPQVRESYHVRPPASRLHILLVFWASSSVLLSLGAFNHTVGWFSFFHNCGDFILVTDRLNFIVMNGYWLGSLWEERELSLHGMGLYSRGGKIYDALRVGWIDPNTWTRSPLR